MDDPTVCRSGPPPHAGWWCSPPGPEWAGRREWRWHDGSDWFGYVQENDDPDEVAFWARQRSRISSGEIFWNDYWPKNARVPRIDPAATSGEKP